METLAPDLEPAKAVRPGRRSFLKAAGGLAGSLYAGCSRRSESRAGGKLRVSGGPYLYLCPFYLALELGYFAAAGFDVEVLHFPASFQAIPLLSSGSLEVTFSAPSGSLINAVIRGGRVRMVAGQDRALPGCSEMGRIYGNRKSFPHGLEDLRALRGKRVAIVSRAGLAEFCLDVFLERAGLSPAVVEIEVLPRAEAVTAVVGGKLDAFIASDHFDKDPISESPNLVRGIALADVCPGFQYTHIMFGRGLLEEDPAVGARFLSAQLRGVREFQRGRTPRFLDEFVRSNGLDRKRAMTACRLTAARDGEIDMPGLRRFLGWTVRKGYCPPSVEAERLTDRRFLGRAGPPSSAPGGGQAE